jgi:hypothetical protein
MDHAGIRELQKISGKAIGTLPVPLKAACPDRLATVLARAQALAKGRGPAADDTALAAFGEVDRVNWSLAAVRELLTKNRSL